MIKFNVVNRRSFSCAVVRKICMKKQNRSPGEVIFSSHFFFLLPPPVLISYSLLFFSSFFCHFTVINFLLGRDNCEGREV